MSKQLTRQDEIILLTFNQLNPKKVKLVACEPMPERVRENVVRNRIIQKQCYCNAAKSVLSLEWCNKLDVSVQYILGVADMGLGFHGHAWIEVDGVQHDPTFELLDKGIEGRKYFEVCRFSPYELCTFLDDNESIPPAFPFNAPRESFDFSFWRTLEDKHQILSM
ncbi:hypothetical protein [Vibrio metschnikovii]|uniref:hypothetical protein n=1 Tax=Vibrio metschnikovii TaxID=28172 RepID=UPI001C301F74|nr:hypothetical protein [Vibrio metschnikovii]